MSSETTLITGVGTRAGFCIIRVFLQRGMLASGAFLARHDSLDAPDRLRAGLK
jgi:hypothetical protein